MGELRLDIHGELRIERCTQLKSVYVEGGTVAAPH